jgi:two-component system KDP operon response regulator KdpE
VWGADRREDYTVLRIYISQMRKKLEDDPLDPKYIVTVPRVG